MQIPEIIECQVLFGEYDIIAKVAVGDHGELAVVILDKIRCLDGILDTKTLTAIK